MQRHLLIGGRLIVGAALLAGTASGQEGRPPAAPPGLEQGSMPRTPQPIDALRLGELSVLQAALGSPSFHLAQPLTEAINLSTMITWNEYVAKSKYFYDVADMLGRRRQARREKRVALGDRRMLRLLYDAEGVDVMTGAAPNALLDQLSKPRISSAMLRRYGETIPGETIQRICFCDGPSGSPISVGRLTVHDGWPLALRGQSFAREERAYIVAIESAIEQTRRGKLTQESYERTQQAVGELRNKLLASSSTMERVDYALAKAFLDNLHAAVEALHQPNAEKVLVEVDSYSGTTVADLMIFMQRCNLRFGPAITHEERASYRTVYTAMLRLRDGLELAGIDFRRLDVKTLAKERRSLDIAPPDRGAASRPERSELSPRPADRRPASQERPPLARP